jgi:hypothetical protein
MIVNIKKWVVYIQIRKNLDFMNFIKSVQKKYE